MNTIFNLIRRVALKPEGKKYRTRIHPRLYVLAALILITTCANATLHVDEFEYTKPSSNTFSYDIFRHNVVSHPESGLTVWDISTNFSPLSGNALDLWPAADVVTLSLEPDQYIDYISVDMISWADDTKVEIIAEYGSVEMYVYQIGTWYNVDTSYFDLSTLGSIIMIKMISSEGAFDNLTVNVVPEPATILLLILGITASRQKIHRRR